MLNFAGQRYRDTGTMDTKEPPVKTPLWEDVVIILAIFTLWPAVLRRESILSRVVLVITIGVLIWLFIRRSRRFRDYVDHAGKK